MRTIRISEEVWTEIAKRGVFGETPDIVLRRVFKINKGAGDQSSGIISTRKKARYARDRLTTRVEENTLFVQFASGASKSFRLPDRLDKSEISNLTANVMNFVKEHGGTEGQINASRKALTDAGYHITK